MTLSITSNIKKYYQILCKSDKIVSTVNLVVTQNNKVAITKGISFFYCYPIYCIEFYLLDKPEYKCYFELINGEIVINFIDTKYSLELINLDNLLILDEEEFELPELITKMFYKWHICTENHVTNIITTFDGCVKVVQKVFILEISYVDETIIYTVSLKYGINFLNCQIIFEKQKPFIKSKYKKLLLVKHDSDELYDNELYDIFYNGNKLITFWLSSNNNIILFDQYVLRYNGTYWIEYIYSEDFFAPFKLNGFNLEPKDDDSRIEFDYQPSMKEIFQDFTNSMDLRIIKNTSEMLKLYNIYYNNQRVANLFCQKEEIRLNCKINYLLYNGMSYILYFNMKIIKSKKKLLLIEKNLKENKNLLECKFVYLNERLVVLTEGFSAKMDAMVGVGTKFLELFDKLSPANKENYDIK